MVTVKEQLAARVARMSEAEAAEALRVLDARAGRGSTLRELVEATRLGPPLSEEEAERLAYEELRAMRREDDGAA